MIPKRDAKQILAQLSDTEEFSSIVDNVAIIKNTNFKTRKSLESVVNQEMLDNFQKIEEAIINLQRLFEDTKKPILKSQNSHIDEMSYVSLFEILKQSIPVSIPSEIFIKLPRHDYAIKGIKKKLVTLFSSLIRNSIQAMDKKGTITIRAFESNKQVRIELEDTGNGIPEEMINQLFVAHTTTKKFGTGLGTSLAKSIVDMHGGTISAKNNPTTFTIQLPVYE
ncbi:sensor histidine kinase [Nitrosopumilus adriaticus]|uniref:sensor histidine kinase n=1 Tax=Nitrosopumilus adriaticus TaxID=1580092 RepID=UPI00352DF7EF